MIVYKNVIEKLKAKGYSTYRIRQEKLLSESVIQHIRDNKSITLDNLEIICKLLECKIDDIVEFR